MTLWGMERISVFGPNFRGLSNSVGFSLELNMTFCSVRLTVPACVYFSLQVQVLLPPRPLNGLGDEEGLVQGHTAGEWLHQGWNRGLLAPYPVPSLYHAA